MDSKKATESTLWIHDVSSWSTIGYLSGNIWETDRYLKVTGRQQSSSSRHTIGQRLLTMRADERTSFEHSRPCVHQQGGYEGGTATTSLGRCRSRASRRSAPCHPPRNAQESRHRHECRNVQGHAVSTSCTANEARAALDSRIHNAAFAGAFTHCLD